MKTRWQLVGLVVLGSVIVACAQQAIEQAMDPDGGGDGAVRADVPGVPAGECCEPPPPEEPTVLFEGGTTACVSPAVDTRGYRRIVVHATCPTLFNAWVEVKHSEKTGFVRYAGVEFCESDTGTQAAAILDAALGVQMRFRLLSCNAEASVALVGYR